MICEIDKCTGCHSCYNVCPKKCIDMREDEFGFIYPNINDKECVNCNLCKNSCPELNYNELKSPKAAYAAWALDGIERDSSTSGGVASIFSRFIIKKGGVVFGASLDNILTVRHIKVTNEYDLIKLKGSKYVHSIIGNTYTECLDELKSNKIVLFIGTPCQISGLKNFLKKDYQNLYTLDIICHGVPSQKYLNSYIKQIYGKKDYDSIVFRDIEGYNFKLLKGDREKFKTNRENNFYNIGFLQSLFSRKNCYRCSYAKSDRISDITIGDFWGIGKEKKFEYSTERGVSVLLPITEKGINLVKECKKYMFIEKREISEAVNGNDQLRHPSIKHKNYEKFKRLYLKKGFKRACEKSLQVYFIKNKIKKNKYIYKFVTNLKSKVSITR